MVSFCCGFYVFVRVWFWCFWVVGFVCLIWLVSGFMVGVFLLELVVLSVKESVFVG